MKTIPQQILNFRTNAGLSQDDLAKLLKKTTGAICNYEKGRRPIRAADFEKIKTYCLKKQNKRRVQKIRL